MIDGQINKVYNLAITRSMVIKITRELEYKSGGLKGDFKNSFLSILGHFYL